MPSNSDIDGQINNNKSYTQMAAADVAPSTGADAILVGKHCAHSHCNQLDFLPFYCHSCSETFCLDHRTESAHECANPGAWAERRRLAELAKPSIGADRPLRDYVSRKPCASDGCDTIVGTSLVPGVHCTRCNRDYCLVHMLEEEHDCKNLVPIGARLSLGGTRITTNLETEIAQRTRSALDRLKTWTSAARSKAAAPSSSRKPDSPSARAIAVNSLKRAAKGDEKLAPENRIYLYVEAEAASTVAKVPKGGFFYSRDWVVGRVLDAAARSLQVENINNQSEDEADRLRVFHVEGGRLLDFGEKLGKVAVNGNTIVLLRGVGPPPDLIDL